ncbi:RNA methyltransferase [Candidatus Uhrbacteria bacterium]|nr:RNA methyltransferase [Candidatus Uhrbacteria bacterium]
MPTKESIVLVLEDVRSLWNVGAIFRTADALGVSKLYLCGITGVPPRKEITKVALGAERWVRWERRAAAWEVVGELRGRGYMTVALEQTTNSIPIRDFKPRFPLALVLGNEVRGCSRLVLDEVECVVHIPMVGRKESLNVAVAAGIATQILLH